MGEEGNDENVDPEQEQGGVVEEDDIVVISRELNETPKPSGKPAGKRARDKLEVQTRMLDLLEKDMTSSATTDPIEMQFQALSQRVKEALPKNQQFSLAIKLAGIAEEHIQAHERGQVLNTQPAAQVNLQVPQMPATQMNQMAPPQMNQMAPPQMNQMPPPPQPMMARQDGGFFNERQLTYTEL